MAALYSFVQRLFGLHEPEIARLLCMLCSTDADAQVSAARQLGTLGTGASTAIPTLARVLTSTTDEYVRAAVAEALGGIGTEAVPYLIDMLDCGSAETCLSAAYAFGMIRPSSDVVIQRLTGLLLKDFSRDSVTWAQVQSTAVEALGKLGPAAVHAIPALLQHDGPSVASALGRIGPPAIPALVKALPKRVAQDALCKIGSPAIPLLVESLASDLSDVRFASTEILKSFGSDAREAVTPLLSLARNDKDSCLRLQAAIAILQIHPDALSVHEFGWLASQVAANLGEPYEIAVPSHCSELVRHILKSLGVRSVKKNEYELGMCRFVTVFYLERSDFDLVRSALGAVWKFPSLPRE